MSLSHEASGGKSLSRLSAMPSTVHSDCNCFGLEDHLPCQPVLSKFFDLMGYVGHGVKFLAAFQPMSEGKNDHQ